MPWRTPPDAAPLRVVGASGATTTEAAGHSSTPSVAAGPASGAATLGVPHDVVIPTAAPSAPGGPCLPTPPLEEGPPQATGRATTATGFSRGTTRPAGRSPHSSKLGICLTKSSLPEQRYSKAPPCRTLPGEGSRSESREPSSALQAPDLPPGASCGLHAPRRPTSSGNDAGEGQCGTRGTPSPPWVPSHQAPSSS